MAGQKIFPTKDDGRNTYFTNAIPYLHTNKARLGITTGNDTDLGNLLTDWINTYPLAKNADTSTKTLRNHKNDLVKSIEDKLRKVYKDIPDSSLTTSDRNTLNLKERDITPTARGKIAETAFLQIAAASGGDIAFTLRTETDSSRASRHPQSDGGEIVYSIGTTAPATPDDCNKTFFTSKAKGAFNVGMGNSGKKLFGFVRWKNNSNPTNSGPYSDLFTINLKD